MQSIWERYYRECHAIVFVVDSSDPERIEECRDALGKSQIWRCQHSCLCITWTGLIKNLDLLFLLQIEKVITDDTVEGIPVLMLANKQDVPTALKLESIKEIFNQIAERLGARDSRVLPISALEGYTCPCILCYGVSSGCISHLDTNQLFSIVAV